MTRAGRAFVVAAYFVAFWLALPLLLFRLAGALDARLGWTRGPLPLAGVLPALLGAGLMAWAIAGLWSRGRGLPVSALPPPRLVRSGAYAVCRHPIYLGFNLALLGAGLLAGSPALAGVVAPALLPAWLVYATAEERALRRRHGEAWRRYARAVGLVPRLRLYALTRLAVAAGVFRVRTEGAVPRRGPVVLVANHACYLDPIYVGALTRRVVHFLTTAEAYRRAPLRQLVDHMHNVPVRRYRPDVAACREMLRLLAEGEVVGIFPEGERSPTGDYRGSDPRVAAVLARLRVPVVPVAIEGAYDCGPRWADVVRLRPVRVRAGPPITWTSQPALDLDAALRRLLPDTAPALDLAGLPRERLRRVVWRCPACGEEPAWQAAALACGRCGAQGDAGSLPRLAAQAAAWPEAQDVVDEAEGWEERSLHGPPEPLHPLGRGRLVIGAGGLSFGELRLAAAEIRSVSTERADTLQVASAERMWQFRPASASVFRLERILRGAQAPYALRPRRDRRPSSSLRMASSSFAPPRAR